jgi:MFS family permease
LTVGAATSLPVRRNTLILAATMAVYSAVLQLVAAVSSLTFVLVTGVEGLLGLGPAIFLTASALTAVPAGRAMDRLGRKPVVGGGFLAAAAGCGLTALATGIGSTPLVILGFGLTGAASGIALLIRAAAGDMYPPERRARGISYVLFGAVFGAILGPAVFGPLFAGRDVEAQALTVPCWPTSPARPSAASCSGSTTCSRACSERRWRCWAATRSTRSASRRWRSARP